MQWYERKYAGWPMIAYCVLVLASTILAACGSNSSEAPLPIVSSATKGAPSNVSIESGAIATPSVPMLAVTGGLPNTRITTKALSSSALRGVDFNADGLSDILWTHDSGAVYVWNMSGTRAISGNLLANVGTEWAPVPSTGDYNGDGRSDIFWRHVDGDVALWLLGPSGVLSSVYIGYVPLQWRIVDARGDYNGDGKSDILWRHSSGETAIWLMNGSNIVDRALLSPAMSSDWALLKGSGDYDGDGKSDLLWRNVDGTVAMWLMDGLALRSSNSIDKIALSWTVLDGAGDYDGDGKSDLLWRDNRGVMGIWAMNGFAVKSWIGWPSVGSEWSVADATSDFDRDGRSDVIWRRNDGAVYIALTRPDAVTGLSSLLTSAVDLQWRINSGVAAFAPAAVVATPVNNSTTITVAGTARYDSVPVNPNTGGLSHSATSAKPIRGAVVEVYSSAANVLLASGLSDDSGKYSITVDNPGAAVWVRVRAQLLRQGAGAWDIRVADNTQGAAQYVLDTAPKSIAGGSVVIDPKAASGWTGTNYGDTRAAAPFAILDTVYSALLKLREADASRNWPRLNLYWSTSNRAAAGDKTVGLIGSSSYSGPDLAGVHSIHLLGDADVDTDEFDKHVIAHEFGHYLQQVASRNDSIGGAHGAESLDMRVAYSEGWGDGWSTIATGDPIYVDTYGVAQSTGGVHNISRPLTSNPGWYRSDTVAYLFWAFNEQVGFPLVWQALTANATVNSSSLGNLHLFAAALKSVATSKVSIIDSLLATQAVTAVDALGSTEVNNGGIADSLPIYKLYPGLGSKQTLCANIAPGTPDPLNKHGNWAFSRVKVTASRTYTLALTGGTDPDFRLYGPNGFEAVAISSVAGSETRSLNLAVGDYVLAATEFSATGRTCLTFSLN